MKKLIKIFVVLLLISVCVVFVACTKEEIVGQEVSDGITVAEGGTPAYDIVDKGNVATEPEFSFDPDDVPVPEEPSFDLQPSQDAVDGAELPNFGNHE